jgi:hypothetical protein
MAADPRKPLPLDGPVAERVRALMAQGSGRPSILAALLAEGHDVTDNQLRTLYTHLRDERREHRDHVREEAVARAVEVLTPGVPEDLEVLRKVRDTMARGMRRAMRAADFGSAAACAGRATAAAKARLDIAGVNTEGDGPRLTEDEAARILREEFGDTGALRTSAPDAAPPPVTH